MPGGLIQQCERQPHHLQGGQRLQLVAGRLPAQPAVVEQAELPLEVELLATLLTVLAVVTGAGHALLNVKRGLLPGPLSQQGLPGQQVLPRQALAKRLAGRGIQPHGDEKGRERRGTRGM
ncbi:hypothetical protein D3C78_1170180 [compost metagenome]